MKAVNVHEAKTHLSRLLARVAGGEDVVIAKAGKPVARLVPIAAARARRTAGIDKGSPRTSTLLSRPRFWPRS